ncbi:hypothetical protein [Amantichitinum ursilacus]|uniref:hypothetical protein n=1 Tax=Amantichitinum ursilacus TaxID=857265 RepID=UPI00128FCC97|nr:hypothetical protein [Amantichitinum ursilacus]
MTSTLSIRHAGVALVAALILAGCASTSSPTTASTAHSGNVITPVPLGQPLPDTKLPKVTAAPSVLIAGRPAAAILDDVVKYRTGKGMTLRNRSSNKAEFAQTIPNAKQPTEARMVYLLAPVNGGLQLSARVFQVSYPGTAREKVAEITGVVADKLNQELGGYAQGGNWH